MKRGAEKDRPLALKYLSRHEQGRNSWNRTGWQVRIRDDDGCMITRYFADGDYEDSSDHSLKAAQEYRDNILRVLGRPLTKNRVPVKKKCKDGHYRVHLRKTNSKIMIAGKVIQKVNKSYVAVPQTNSGLPQIVISRSITRYGKQEALRMIQKEMKKYHPNPTPVIVVKKEYKDL